MNSKLKDEKKIDFHYYKIKAIKAIKVITAIIFVLTIYHFVVNFKEYRAICNENDLPIDNIIISNKTLEELSNKYSIDGKSSNFNSPLDNEKDKLKVEIKNSIDSINKKVSNIKKKSMIKSEQVTFDEISISLEEIDYINTKDYKVSELEEIEQSYTTVEKKLTTLSKEINMRVLKKDITKLNKEINELSTEISEKALTSVEKSTHESIEENYSILNKDVDKLSEIDLKSLKKDLSDVFSNLKQLNEQITKRLAVEQEKIVEKSTQVLENNNNNSNINNNNNNNNVKQNTQTGTSKQATEQVKQNTNSTPKTEAAPQKKQSNMCYGTYEEAQQVGMNTMLNDASIQKMEVDGSTNCIKYYR